jgi:hypothetical protein
VVKVPRGTANLKGIAITMPSTELIDSAHLQDPCTQALFAEGSTPGERCPPGSVIGHARVLTPALGAPLGGLVYLRSSGRKLPDLVVALNGQVDIDLTARIDAVHGGLRAAFAALPDVPLSKLTLALEGGDRGLLENGASLCASAARAGVRMAGQNGKSVGQAALLGTGCHRR